MKNKSKKKNANIFHVIEKDHFVSQKHVPTNFCWKKSHSRL